MKPQYNKTLLFITFLILLLQGCTRSTNGPLDGGNSNGIFDGGSGTEANPYQISTIEQLQAIGDEENLDKHFIQVADIDASSSAEFQDGSGFKRIGTIEKPFTGSYNGNGHKIIDLKIHSTRSDRRNGLFGYVKNALIENVTVDNSASLSQNKLQEKPLFLNTQEQVSTSVFKTIDPSETGGIGGLVGVNDGGVIRNCKFIGLVGGSINKSPAGLVGGNTGLIDNSHFKGSVSGGGGIGLVGWNTGEIIHSSATGKLSGMTAYGLVGINFGTITHSHADIEIWGSNLSAGLVGRNEGGRIESSYVKGLVSGHWKSAGLVVYNSGEIHNSYSISTVDVSFVTGYEEMKAAGLVAENQAQGTIHQSFAAGTVMVSGGPGKTYGFATHNEGTITSSYWDTDTTGQNEGVGEGNPDGATGLSTAQMTGPAAETHMPEFDWQTVWRSTDSYPVLRWQGDE